LDDYLRAFRCARWFVLGLSDLIEGERARRARIKQQQEEAIQRFFVKRVLTLEEEAQLLALQIEYAANRDRERETSSAR
jgi:hypothetical protein